VRPDRFRVDVRVLGEDCEIGQATVYGATLEDAIVSVLALLSPHVQDGSAVQILNTGVYCNECEAYHPCTDRLLRQHAAGVEEAPPLSMPEPENGLN